MVAQHVTVNSKLLIDGQPLLICGCSSRRAGQAGGFHPRPEAVCPAQAPAKFAPEADHPQRTGQSRRECLPFPPRHPPEARGPGGRRSRTVGPRIGCERCDRARVTAITETGRLEDPPKRSLPREARLRVGLGMEERPPRHRELRLLQAPDQGAGQGGPGPGGRAQLLCAVQAHPAGSHPGAGPPRSGGFSPGLADGPSGFCALKVSEPQEDVEVGKQYIHFETVWFAENDLPQGRTEREPALGKLLQAKGGNRQPAPPCENCSHKSEGVDRQ